MKRTKTKVEHRKSSVMELETVVVRLLAVADRHPDWFGMSGSEDEAYSVDLLDGLAWAISAFRQGIAGLPGNDPSAPYLRQRLFDQYEPAQKRIEDAGNVIDDAAEAAYLAKHPVAS
jgi:hypothetical protein